MCYTLFVYEMRVFLHTQNIIFGSLIFLVVVLFLLYNLNKLFEIDNYENVINKIAEANVEADGGTNIDTCKNLKSNNQWIINQNVLQYSSYLIILDKAKVKLRIESLVMFNHLTFKSDFSSIKCLLKYNMNDARYINVTNMIQTPTAYDFEVRYNVKVQCDFDNEDHLSLSDIFVAVIDTKDYKFTDETEPTNGKVVLNWKYISYQIPTVIDTTKPKEKAVAHCVHMVRDFNEITSNNRFISWLNLQHKIGYAKIRLYLFDDITVESLKKYFTSNKNSINFDIETFVDYIDYKVDYKKLCKCQINQNKKSSSKSAANTGTSISAYLLNQCELHYKKYFHAITSEASPFESKSYFWQHEKLQTNDCYLNLKYKYEFISNYDLDEFILPRSISGDNQFMKEISQSKSLVKCDHCNFKNYFENVNIYDYSVKLFNKLKNQDKNISNLLFEYTYYVEFSDVLMDQFFKQMNENVKSHDINNQDELFMKLLLHESDSVSKYLGFRYKTSDIDHMKELPELYKLINCFKKNTNVRTNPFNRALYAEIHGGQMYAKTGKSIYHTTYTNTIAQHHADNIEEGTRPIMVPIEFGFVGHFRSEPLVFFKRESFQITSLKFDFEYYLYFLSKFSDKLC